VGEKSIFKEIKDSLDEIMSGRRYLISTVEKLKKSLPEIGPEVERLSSSIQTIQGMSEVSENLTTNLNELRNSLEVINKVGSDIETMKNDIQNMSNNVMQLRPILDSIRDYSQRQENGMKSLAQAVQTVMTRMGKILAKLE
jgi:methyl-accepting chemotaxis protein